MASQDDFDDDDERVTRTTRRPPQATDRLPSREVPQNEPLRSDWLSSRTAGRATRRRAATVPSSRQEFVLWLQYGGWRTVALVAAGTFAVLILLSLAFNRMNANPIAAQPTAEAGAGGSLGGPLLPTLDPLEQPSVTPLADAAGGTTAGAAVQFRVFNTEGQGLLLRSDHVIEPNNILDTLPDGTIVSIIGEDFVGPNYVWKNVRAPSGQEGWAATDFLQQVQP